jgi:hypothetical protein
MTCTIGLHSLYGHTCASIVEAPLIQQPLTICYPRQLQFALSSSFVFSRSGTQWAPNDIPNPVRVHGALYSSEALIVTFTGKAHWRDSPRERRCLLPRIMVGLVFASDGTQLTAFQRRYAVAPLSRNRGRVKILTIQTILQGVRARCLL